MKNCEAKLLSLILKYFVGNSLHKLLFILIHYRNSYLLLNDPLPHYKKYLFLQVCFTCFISVTSCSVVMEGFCSSDQPYCKFSWCHQWCHQYHSHQMIRLVVHFACRALASMLSGEGNYPYKYGQRHRSSYLHYLHSGTSLISLSWLRNLSGIKVLNPPVLSCISSSVPYDQFGVSSFQYGHITW